MNLFIALVTVVFCGYLWHLGGQGKVWCRVIVGPVIAIVKLFIMHAWLVLGYAAALPILVSCFSYGLGAPVHKFWVWVLKKGADGSDLEVEYATRATCGFFWSLGGIVFVYAGGSWIHQIVYTVVATLFVGFFGVVPDVTLSEHGTGEMVSLSIFI